MEGRHPVRPGTDSRRRGDRRGRGHSPRPPAPAASARGASAASDLEARRPRRTRPSTHSGDAASRGGPGVLRLLPAVCLGCPHDKTAKSGRRTADHSWKAYRTHRDRPPLQAHLHIREAARTGRRPSPGCRRRSRGCGRPPYRAASRWRLASGVGFLEADVPTARILPGRAPGIDEDRQVHVVMEVGVQCPSRCHRGRANGPGASRCAPSGRGLELGEELGEQRDVEPVDLGHPRDLLRVIPVMRERVVRVGDADLGVGPAAGLAGECWNVMTRVTSPWLPAPGGRTSAGHGRHRRPERPSGGRDREATLSSASASAFWIRRSTSRTVSRYWPTRARSAGPSRVFSRAISSVTESSRLARFFQPRLPAIGGGALAEEAFRKTIRGWASDGSGVARRRPRPGCSDRRTHTCCTVRPSRAGPSRSSRDGNCVSWPICRAAI